LILSENAEICRFIEPEGGMIQSNEKADIEVLSGETLNALEDQCRAFVEDGASLFCTSSFQTQSVPLLHMIASLQNLPVQVVMIDTGFMFPETYLFMNSLAKQFDLDVTQVRSKRSYVDQLGMDNRFLYASDFERCCAVNKVEPMEELLKPGDVWISGIRADQSSVRAEKKIVETDARGVIRYHPMLSWTARDVYRYIRMHHLPRHPLEDSGYKSIGCIPCTRKWNALDAQERNGRWEGSQKTECGLHL